MSEATDVKEDRRYTKDHEWVRVEGDTGTIGITNFAQQQLGDDLVGIHFSSNPRPRIQPSIRSGHVDNSRSSGARPTP